MTFPPTPAIRIMNTILAARLSVYRGLLISCGGNRQCLVRVVCAVLLCVLRICQEDLEQASTPGPSFRNMYLCRSRFIRHSNPFLTFTVNIDAVNPAYPYPESQRSHWPFFLALLIIFRGRHERCRSPVLWNPVY